jgi:hypothetical protein
MLGYFIELSLLFRPGVVGAFISFILVNIPTLLQELLVISNYGNNALLIATIVLQAIANISFFIAIFTDPGIIKKLVI